MNRACRSGNPLEATGGAGAQGIPFGFAQGRLSTAVVLRVREAQPSLRCNEDQKGVPPRVEYVLEAQALKEARDDPRWRRSSPEILLHDGAGSKRQDCTGGTGDQREAGTAAGFSAVSWAGRAGGGGGVRLLAGVSRSGGTGSRAVGAGASAAGEGDCLGEAESGRCGGRTCRWRWRRAASGRRFAKWWNRKSSGWCWCIRSG